MHFPIGVCDPNYRAVIDKSTGDTAVARSPSIRLTRGCLLERVRYSAAGQLFGPGSQQPLSFPVSQQVLSFPGQPLYQNGGSPGFFSYGAQLNQTRMPYTSVPIGAPYNAVGGAGAPREPLGPSYLRSNSPMPTYLGAQPPSANVGGYQYFQSAAALASSPAQGFSSVGFAATRPPELNAASQYARPTSDTRLLSRFSPAASVSVSSDLTGATSQLTTRSDGVSDAGGGGRPRSESAAAATTNSSAYSPITSAAAAQFPASSSWIAHALLMSLASNRFDLLANLQQHFAAAAVVAAASSSVPSTSFSTTQGARKPAFRRRSRVRERCPPVYLSARLHSSHCRPTESVTRSSLLPHQPEICQSNIA